MVLAEKCFNRLAFDFLVKHKKCLKQEILKRYVTYKKCIPYNKAKCDISNLRETLCYKDIEQGRILPNHFLQDFWVKEECCLDPCKDALMRFDDLYYFTSNKATKKYTRTWEECSGRKFCRRRCCLDAVPEQPSLPKRSKEAVIDTACPGDPNCLFLRGFCANPMNPKQRRMRTCPIRRHARPSCLRFCAPYPSFSECIKDQKGPASPNECNCLRLYSNCEIIKGMLQGLPYRLQRC